MYRRYFIKQAGLLSLHPVFSRKSHVRQVKGDISERSDVSHKRQIEMPPCELMFDSLIF
jgi:hypothetical protein